MEAQIYKPYLRLRVNFEDTKKKSLVVSDVIKNMISNHIYFTYYKTN